MNKKILGVSVFAFSMFLASLGFSQAPAVPTVPTAPKPSTTTAPATPVVPTVPAPPTSRPAPSAGTPQTPRYEDLSKTNSPAATPPKTAGGPQGLTSTDAGGDEGFFLNAVDTDIREIIKQISKAAGKNFLIDDKVRGKVTILSERKMTLEEAYQAFLSALEVLGFTVVTGPGDLVKIVPLKDALTNPIPIYKEDSPFTDSFITRITSLKNVSALDISSAIKPLISKEGNLFAIPATNTLIMTDSGSNIDRLLKIIKEMDTQGPEQMIEIVKVKNASAKDVADKVQKLYLDQSGAGGAKRASKPGDLEDVPFISKVIPDERTNSVIILASKRAMPKVRELMAQLDKAVEGPQGKVHVHYLKNAEAKKMADVLSALTGTSSSKAATPGATPGGAAATAKTGGAPTVAEFEGGIKIAADESTNSLIITSTQKDYETLVDEVINRLDIPRRQVYVEVVIMELSIDKNRDVGVSGQGGAPVDIGGNSTNVFGSLLGGTSTGLAAALSGAGAAGLVANDSLTFTKTNADGTTTTVTVPKFGYIINALQTDRNVNVLSTPNLLTLDNEEAEIVVGSEEPFPTGTTVTSGGNSTFNVTRQNVGITLKITPQVNEGDMVRLKVKQEITAVIPGTSEAVLVSLGPSTTKRAVETVIVAKDQQTVVIGGLIDDKMSQKDTKIPFLGDIPLLGNLFKRKEITKTKTNILVFLRPYIIRDTTDFLKVLQRKVEERNMFIEQNYGASQQKSIRQSIRSHTAELLEFKKDVQVIDHTYEPVQMVAPKSKLYEEVPPTPAPAAKPVSSKSSAVKEKNISSGSSSSSGSSASSPPPSSSAPPEPGAPSSGARSQYIKD